MDFKKLFCKHDYDVIDAWKDDWHIIQQWQCKKCGRERIVEDNGGKYNMTKKMICYPFRAGNMLEYTPFDLTDEQRLMVYNGETVVTGFPDRPQYDVTWKPQEVLELTLSYAGYTRGRSAVTFYWRDEHGHIYPMFIKDFDDLLLRHIGTTNIHAVFTYVKRGQNYGIKLLEKTIIDEPNKGE